MGNLGKMALDRNIQLKVSLSDTELLQILRDRAADLHGRPRYLLANSATANSKSDVVACFDPTLDSVTLTGHLNRHRPVQFTLKRDSQTYQNFIRLFLKELRSISAAEELAESVSVGGDATRAVQELTDHLEAKLGSIVPKQEMREVGAEVEKTLSESSRCSQLDEIPETIDVYSADFEATSEVGILEASERLTGSCSSSAKRKLGLARRSLLQRLRTKERSFRIVEAHSEEPRPISAA